MSNCVRPIMKTLPVVFAFLLANLSANAAAALPGAKPLDWEGDLSAKMVAGINGFLTKQTVQAAEQRAQYWKRDASSPAAYGKSVQPNRDRLRNIIGAVDERAPITSLEFVQTTAAPEAIYSNARLSIHVVRWQSFSGVHGEGLLLQPKGSAKACIVAIPDADQTPEQIAGLAPGVAPESQFALRLAEAGCIVLVPTLVNRQDTWSGNAAAAFTNQTHREWIYRQAFEMGRHIIGYEVQKILSAVDWFAHKNRDAAKPIPIGVAGYGEGGLLALYAAALDTRISATMVSGYFAPRQNVWAEPIYRNVFGLLREFGDAEIASLIAPRALIIEQAPVTAIAGPPQPRQGRRGGAAPGKISTPETVEVQMEFERAKKLAGKHSANWRLVESKSFGGAEALGHFLTSLGGTAELPPSTPAMQSARLPDVDARQKRQVDELVEHTQRLLRFSEYVREANFWKVLPPGTSDKWAAQCEPHRERFAKEVIGQFPPASLPINPRSRQILETEKWTGHDVVLDVWGDVFAWGILLVPKDLKPGERRPVVVCQHGLEGVPMDTVTRNPKDQPFQYYKGFSAELADRGFIVFAPHNPYRGQDAFRVLQRKANPLGRSLFSVIVGQHDRIIDWLETLPFVDKQRIGFYGLSYGGKTAMRVPALVNRYCLSICSADFNEWVKKNVTVDSRYSYMFTGEYEMFEYNLGHTFNYAEMGALIAPRPFMVERGHNDGVAPDEWVAYEYAKIRRIFAYLGVADRTEIEYFNGPHTINGQATYKFLHRHLRWPERN